MAKVLPDYPILDFSGGIRRDKSTYKLKDNELQDGKNFDVDEEGRIIKRRGGIQLGETEATFNSGFVFIKQTVATPKIDMIINDWGANTYTLVNDNVKTAALVAGVSTTLTVNSETFETGVVEVEGPFELLLRLLNRLYGVLGPLGELLCLLHTTLRRGNAHRRDQESGTHQWKNNLFSTLHCLTSFRGARSRLDEIGNQTPPARSSQAGVTGPSI